MCTDDSIIILMTSPGNNHTYCCCFFLHVYFSFAEKALLQCFLFIHAVFLELHLAAEKWLKLAFNNSCVWDAFHRTWAKKESRHCKVEAYLSHPLLQDKPMKNVLFSVLFFKVSCFGWSDRKGLEWNK